METIINYVYQLSRDVPLVWFTLIGTILEEIIGPIPSPLVLTTAGSVALSQSRTYYFLFILALIAACIKTITAYVVYRIADRSEDIFTTRFGKVFGLSHTQLERIGSKFNGTNDEAILFLLRIIPILPAFPISVICGIVKFPIKSYMIITLVSNFAKCLGFLLVGYVGVSKFEGLLFLFASTGRILWALVFLMIGSIVIYFLYHYRSRLSELKPNSEKSA